MHSMCDATAKLWWKNIFLDSTNIGIGAIYSGSSTRALLAMPDDAKSLPFFRTSPDEHVNVRDPLGGRLHLHNVR